MKADFSLILFSTDPSLIREAVAAGVQEILIDWENRGKKARQAHADTQINFNTVQDLHRVRKCTSAKVICRVNRFKDMGIEELDEAVRGGADEILLPMVRTREEVEEVLDRVNGRCGVGILVETRDAVKIADRLAPLPLSRVYVGLNDLGIDRGTPNIFTPLVDGTLEQVRRSFHVPFGFGGLTLPNRGVPIPCRLLMGEMARLGCDFSFLRRSFYRDLKSSDVPTAIANIQTGIQRKKLRSKEDVEWDRLQLIKTIEDSSFYWTEFKAGNDASVQG